MNKKIICCDLGGTKCAAGVVEFNQTSGELTCIQRHSVKLADTVSLDDLIEQLSTGLNLHFSKADAICIGAAGQYDGEMLIYAGAYPYPMNFAQLAKKQAWPAYAIVHDYTPVVCATFTNYMHQANNIKWLNAAPIPEHGRRVALGLGTGVGMKDGVLLPNGDFWLGKNEVGHIGITLPPLINDAQLNRHIELTRFLQSQQPVTFEKILSGQGIANLYHFLYPNQKTISPEEAGQQIQANQANELLEMFAWYLGLLVGTIQLTFMPEGGIWLAGGVTMHHLDVFDHSEFYAGIHASPAYAEQRKHYPLGILCNPDHVLLGGAYYAVKRLFEISP